MVVPLLVAPHVLVQEGNHLSAPESNGDIRPIQNYGAYAPTTGANRDILPMQEITQVGYGSRADEQMDNTKAASHLTVTRLDKLGKDAEFIDCPYCQERTQTYVVRTNSTMTHVAGGLCCLVGMCCVCIPYCFDWYRDVDHFCTTCKNHITHKTHDGPVQVIQPSQYQSRLQASQYAGAYQQQTQAMSEPMVVQPPPTYRAGGV